MGRKGGMSKTALVEGPLFKNLLLFSLPILLGSFVTQLYNVANSVIVGQFVGGNALAAVSASTPAVNIINMFFMGLSTGSNVVIAQRAGTQRREALQKALNTTAVLTVGFGLLLSIGGVLISSPLLKMLGTPEEIFDDTLAYLILVFVGAFGNLAYNMGSGALRGMGDSVWPFYFLCFCSALNVLLALGSVLILDLGIIGVASSTAIAQFISGLGIVWRINKGDYGVKLNFKTMKIDPFEAKEIAIIGLPAGVQNVGNLIAALCTQAYANSFGSDFIAANNVVNNIDNFINIPAMALSTALCTFVAQNMALFKMDRVKKGINQSILSLVGLGVLMWGGLILASGVLPKLFTDAPAVQAIASQGISIMAFQTVFLGIDRCLVNAMRGAGKSVVPMITAQFGALSRIPLAFFLAVQTDNYLGMFWAMLIAAFLRCAAIGVYYFCGGWKRSVQKFEEKFADQINQAKQEAVAE